MKNSNSEFEIFDCQCRCGAIFGSCNPFAFECPDCRSNRRFAKAMEKLTWKSPADNWMLDYGMTNNSQD